MANDEHVILLKQGILTVWNKWRAENPHIIPELSNADLSKINLNEADLSKVDLSEANLSQANLSRANLSGANLSKAVLVKSNLSRANLIGTDFTGADLSSADLSGANLSKAILIEVNLNQANFSGTVLIETNLSRANLSRLNLNTAKLNRVNFSHANLSYSNLSGLDLNEFDLTSVDLGGANLKKIQALGTNFCTANLTGACIEDWHINNDTNFSDVICDYIYLRQGQQERRPSSGNFAPGEFTKLFQKSLETVDLIFRNGIDWDAFAYSFKKVEVENQGAQLDVQSIEKRNGILVVRVAVDPEADKAKIHNDFMQGYDFALKALEAQYQARLEDKDAVIVRQEAQINRLFDIVEQQESVQKALAENPRKVSNTNIINSQFAGGMVDAINVDAQQIGGNIQNNNTEDFPS
ncbi:pentapeptide repeat-containing protein [Anabaena sp. CCY 9910]|uniref:pentapeptide repeat-containing protein n=1 Tax=Anabaena sp. CCY 9910 TaxID=3103870 RepID=UPI0039E1CFF5